MKVEARSVQFIPIFSLKQDLFIFLGPLSLGILISVLATVFSSELSAYLSWDTQIDIFITIYSIFVMFPHNYATFYKVHCDSKQHPAYYQTSLRVFALFFFLLCCFYTIYGGNALRLMVYVDIIHQIRQQYGWLNIANRKQEIISRAELILDTIMIYNVTLAPVLWLHSHPATIGWLMKGDLYYFLPDWAGSLVLSVHWLINVSYISFYYYWYLKNRVINLNKLMIVLVTWVAWYLGILYLRDGMKIVMIGLIHTFPYLVLIYKYYHETSRKDLAESFSNKNWKNYYVILLAISIIMFGIQVTVTTDRFALNQVVFAIVYIGGWGHYFFDTFIWRARNKETRIDEFFGFEKLKREALNSNA